MKIVLVNDYHFLSHFQQILQLTLSLSDKRVNYRFRGITLWGVMLKAAFPLIWILLRRPNFLLWFIRLDVFNFSLFLNQFGQAFFEIGDQILDLLISFDSVEEHIFLHLIN